MEVIESDRFSDMSYIRARDPSIQYFGFRERLKNVKTNINFPTSDSEDTVVLQPENASDPEIIEEDNSMQVYLRIKASSNELEDYSIQGNQLVCKVLEQPSTSRVAKDSDEPYKKYSFTKIFGPNSKQIEIFNSVVQLRVLEFINGNNRSLFTYGASGAGKTFTVVGTAEEPGLIPRALEYLFRTLPKLPSKASVKPMPDGRVMRLSSIQQKAELEMRESILKSQKNPDRVQNIKTYRTMQARLSNDPAAEIELLEQLSLGIWVSFAEIYNEEIFDLLQTAPAKLKNRLRIGTANGNVYIKDLTHINVSSGLEAYQVFQYGTKKLKYAKTNVNNHSSRSHCIFSIKIAQSLDVGDGVHVSSFSFCDLAGVERSKKTKNVGERLKESNSINTSLMVLGRCIAALRHAQKYPNSNQLIPFRDSKLTQLFQRALSGYENMCMVVNINTSREMLDESHNVLNFSAISKDIMMQCEPQTGSLQDRQMSNSECLENLRQEKIRLTRILQEAKDKYHNLKLNRAKNLQLERERLIVGWEEVLEGNRELYKMKFESFKEELDNKYERELEKMKARHEEKVERAKKRKLTKDKRRENDIKYLKEKFLNQEMNLAEQAQEMSKLKEENLEVIKDGETMEKRMMKELKRNDEIINQLELKIEMKETNSFLKNEETCEFNPFADD